MKAIRNTCLKNIINIGKNTKDANYKDPRINIIFTADAVMRDLTIDI